MAREKDAGLDIRGSADFGERIDRARTLLRSARSDGDRVGGECDDGLCEDGPRPGGGLEWTLTLVTLDDVITPRAPVGYDWKGAPRGPLDGDVYDETPTAAPTRPSLHGRLFDSCSG